jgi:ABC-type multidrug transport system ATPase subunit
MTPAPADATVCYTGPPLAARPDPRRSTAVDHLFVARKRLVIGRAPDCDVVLSHPSVSRYHALLERLPEGLRLRDLASFNGVLVAGRRIEEPVLVRERERVGIGPYLFTVQGGVIHTLDSSRSLRLEARRLEKVVPTSNGPRKLLDNINLAVLPGEFVSLLGPSGSGKSTLMDCLNGRRRATAGEVLANGEDFYRHFDNFRQSLGYVPQKDIVHTQLTVGRALYYTARLRLPPDTDPAGLQVRVEEVLGEMELRPHRDTLVANLSGGQIKRVSLGAELLARPCLLYIDEATSGLDAGTEARMMRLFRRLADEGKSVVCITHNVDNVESCNLVIVLARGKLVFYGPPREAPGWFGVGRLGEIYDRLAEEDLAEWEERFAGSSFHAEFVAKRLQPHSTPTPLEIIARPAQGTLVVNPPAAESPATPSFGPLLADRFRDLKARAGRLRDRLRPLKETWHQFGVLTARYTELVWGDGRSLRLLFLQAPLVALFILAGFLGKPYGDRIPAPRRLTDDERRALEQVAPQVPEGKARELLDGILETNTPVLPAEMIINPRYTYMLLNILVLAVFWFGCNNAAKEIVKEEAIYARERAVNLGILPYLGSKFLVLSVLSAVQVFLLMLVIYAVLEGCARIFGLAVPPAVYRLDYLPQYGVLLLLALTGVALGLLLSACVATPDRATTLLPYVLIPQIILGGGLISVGRGLLHLLAIGLSPVYWAYRAVHRGATDVVPRDFPFHQDYDDRVWISCVALTIQIALLLMATAWFLRRKDMGKA